MTLIPPLVAELRANISEFSAKMKEAQAEAEETSAKSGGSFSKLSSVGKGALLGVAGVAVAVGGASIDLAEKFQTSSASIASNAGITVAAANKIGNAFLTTGFQSTFSAQEMDTAYAAVAGQLGTVQGKALNATQALGFMKAATDLAEASGASLTSTTSTLAGVMQAFQIKTAGAAETANVLFNAARSTGVGTDTLATSLEKLQAKLGPLSPGFQGLSAAVVDMTEHGVTGRAAVSGLSTAMTSLLAPSKAAEKQMTDLGINVVNAKGQFVGMQAAIAQLTPVFARMTQGQQEAAAALIFGKGAAQQMLQVITAGPAAYAKATAAVEKSGAVEAGAAAQAKTLHGQLKTMEAGAEDLGVKLGTLLIPMVTKLIGVTVEIVGWFQKHRAMALALAVVVGGTLLVAIGAFVASLFMAEGALAFLIGPIGLVIGAVAVLAVGIYELVTHWSAVWGFIKRLVTDAVDWVKHHMLLLATTILLPILPLILLLTHWRQVWDFIKKIPGEVVDFIRDHLKLLGEILLGPIGALMILRDHWKSIWGDIAKGPAEAVSAVKHHTALLAEAALGPPGWALIVKQHWKGIWDHLPAPIQNALLNVKPAVAALVSVFERMPGDIAKTGGKVLEAVDGFLAKLPERMAYWAGFATGRFLRELIDLPSQVTHIGEDIVGHLLGWGGDLVAAAARVGTSVVSSIIEFFAQLPGDVVGILGDVASGLAGFIPRAMAWAAQVGSQVIGAVVNFFRGLPGSVVSALTALAGAIAGFVPRVVDAAGRIGKGVLDGIMNFVKQIPGELLSVITNIPHMLENAVGSIASGALHIGKSLLGGFLNGIGKHSPSALERAMDEVIAGLQGKMSPLSGIVGQINGLASGRPTGIAPSALAPAAAVAGAGGVGGGGLTLNVTVQGHVLTPDGLAQSIAPSLRQVLSGTFGRGTAGPVILSGNR